MQIPSSMTETEKLCYLTKKLGELIDMRIDRYIYQIELKKKIVLAEEERNQLSKKIREVVNKINYLNKLREVLSGKEKETN